MKRKKTTWLRKGIINLAGSALALLLTAEQAEAAGLNEWMFEFDTAGQTLAISTNTGSQSAIFPAGGSGFLETDGDGYLVCTRTASSSNEMWTGGAILNANVDDVSDGIHYFRYDLDYSLDSYALTSASMGSGLALGLRILDSTETNVAGFALASSNTSTPAPPGENHTTAASGLPATGRLSAIAKVDVDAQVMTVWYDLTGQADFDENNPSVTNIAIQLSAIDQLQFQATGDFRPDGTTDYAAVDNIRTASTWDDITLPARIAFTVNPLFSGDMVLQRDIDVPIWGTATPGILVTVELDGSTAGTATADETGTWMVRMPARPGDGGVAHTISVSSSDGGSALFSNVVFGDVYLAGGQSNMAMTMVSSYNDVTGYADALTTANDYSLIRQIALTQNASETELTVPSLQSSWTECGTGSLASFCAAGYFFAKEIHQHTGEPVGLLHSAWGGQLIERFLCEDGLLSVPEITGLAQNQRDNNLSGFYDIYNAMIAPLIPYGIRGAIWYQGEANANAQNDRDFYQWKMKALMRGWRAKWNQGDFPFYYVQLANYNSSYNWPDLRDAQLHALSETNSGMAVTIDIGNDGNIHPSNKSDVGKRLAQWALSNEFEFEVTPSGPLFRKTIVEGSHIRVLFDYAENGLYVGQKVSTNATEFVNESLQNFEIAGTNQIFVSATAVIDQDTVLVSSASVPEPAYVRYCFSNAPGGSNKLYNAADLPASPFRTDGYHCLNIQAGGPDVNNVASGTQFTFNAYTAPDGQIFDRWIGGTGDLDDVKAATATVTMPDHSLYLMAIYRDPASLTYTLTVNGGSGDGTSRANVLVNISAETSVAGQAFDHWSGDTQTVFNATAATTTLLMPSNNVSVTAVYRTVDSVGDDISDEWRELYFGGDGSSTNALPTATADPDGDGMSNWQEYKAGTSPIDARSKLELSGEFTSSQFAFGFSAQEGRRYQLQKSDSLSPVNWQTVVYNVLGEDSYKSFSINDEGTDSSFYRVILQND